MAFALLAGCGDAAQAPAGKELAQPAPQAQPAVVSEREDITAPPAVSRNVVDEDEEADKEAQAHAGDSLEAQVQALLASGRRIAARRALRLLLEARQSDEAGTALAEPAERAARTLIDWDKLALAHDATGLAERDLPFEDLTNLLPADGFWAAGPHVATRATWTYPELRLVLERYVIQTPTKVREFWNWTHCLTVAEVEAELNAVGFEVEQVVGDAAGGPFDAASPTFAVVARAVG